jgi:integrase/recombinase XerC
MSSLGVSPLLPIGHSMAYRLLCTVPLPDVPPAALSADCAALKKTIADGYWNVIKTSAPPGGFYLIFTTEGALFEPAFFWLREAFIMNKGQLSVGNTQKAYCNDLYEWLVYLSLIDKRWDIVCEDDLSTYVDKLQSLPSARGRPYEATTIRRRMSTILAFYKWAANENLLAHPISEVAAPKTVVIHRSNDSDALAHTHVGPLEIETSRLLPRLYRKLPNDRIPDVDLQRILSRLGGNPSDPTDSRPRRNRLTAELSCSTGARIDEVSSLTLAQFLTLKQDPANQTYPLLLSKTKGLVPRNIYIAYTLYDSLKDYADNEREEALELSKKKTCDSFFVNFGNANRNPGTSLKGRSISKSFHQTVLECGLYETFLDPNGIEQKDAHHSFHSLRHTFAVNMYYLLKKNGEPDPWLKIKVLLGHAHVKTTVDTYLRSISALDADASDALNAALISLRKEKNAKKT